MCFARILIDCLSQCPGRFAHSCLVLSPCCAYLSCSIALCGVWWCQSPLSKICLIFWFWTNLREWQNLQFFREAPQKKLKFWFWTNLREWQNLQFFRETPQKNCKFERTRVISGPHPLCAANKGGPNPVCACGALASPLYCQLTACSTLTQQHGFGPVRHRQCPWQSNTCSHRQHGFGRGPSERWMNKGRLTSIPQVNAPCKPCTPAILAYYATLRILYHGCPFSVVCMRLCSITLFNWHSHTGSPDDTFELYQQLVSKYEINPMEKYMDQFD